VTVHDSSGRVVVSSNSVVAESGSYGSNARAQGRWRCVSGIPAAGRDDPVTPPDSADGVGCLGVVVPAEPKFGTADCNSAVHDRNGSRSEKSVATQTNARAQYKFIRIIPGHDTDQVELPEQGEAMPTRSAPALPNNTVLLAAQG
jgi:hypothetical protein